MIVRSYKVDSKQIMKCFVKANPLFRLHLWRVILKQISLYLYAFLYLQKDAASLYKQSQTTIIGIAGANPIKLFTAVVY